MRYVLHFLTRLGSRCSTVPHSHPFLLQFPDSPPAQAAHELQLISPAEREAVTRKYHVADARMSLASALLKRLFVSKTLGIPWTQVRYGRKRDPTHGKPCALLPDGSQAPIEFNVTHQNGLVALVGCNDPDAELGVDLVCTNERVDYAYKLIDREGLDGWVDIYEDIFSDEEMWDMKYNVDPFPLLDGTEITAEMLGRYDRVCKRGQLITATLPSGEMRTFSSDLLIDAKLRKFYVYWCFKEALSMAAAPSAARTAKPCSQSGSGNSSSRTCGLRARDLPHGAPSTAHGVSVSVTAKPGSSGRGCWTCGWRSSPLRKTS